MIEILKQILQELNQAKIDSKGTYRTGDYRIGLTKAETIVNDKLHMHIVNCQREQLKVKHTLTFEDWFKDKYIDLGGNTYQNRNYHFKKSKEKCLKIYNMLGISL